MPELSLINGEAVPHADDITSPLVSQFIDNFWMREKALDTTRRTQEEEYINQRQLMFNKCSKMTARVMFSRGNVCLGDGKIHEKYESSTTTENKLY
jgi:hypothetical protein